jgi:hypothetical protein
MTDNTRYPHDNDVITPEANRTEATAAGYNKRIALLEMRLASLQRDCDKIKARQAEVNAKLRILQHVVTDALSLIKSAVQATEL